ncbi:hypothetical protein [Viscerimonas tarda]
MLNKQCPLCGKQINEEEGICKDCLGTAKEKEFVTIPVDEEQPEETEPDKPAIEAEEQPQSDDIAPVQLEDNKKKAGRINKKVLIFSLSGVLVCIAVGVYLFIADRDLRREQEIELNTWYSCIEENTPVAYSIYLQTYPQGKFRNEASSKIGKLRETERLAWEKLKNSADIDEYYNFLRIYPNTPFKSEAKKMMDSLSWETAVKSNTAESYQFYLETLQSGYITGLYKGMAEERHDYLKQIKDLTEEESENVKKTINVLFQVLSKQDTKELNTLFSKIITNFYGARNRSATAIITSIKADMDRNNIKTLSYDPDLGSLKTCKDGKGIVIIEINVKKKIAFKIKKVAEEIDEVLHIDINPDMTIKSLYPKDKKSND